MIEKIIGATIVPDIDDLTWPDQIGWMVKPWTKRIEVGEGQFKDKIAPVAEFVTNTDCTVNDFGLHILNTDKSYANMILISAEGDMAVTPAENIPRRKALNIEQDIKIAVWLQNHHGGTHLAKGELIKLLWNKIYRQVKVQWPYTTAADSDYDMFINKMKLSFVRELIENPFSEYSFSEDQAQFNYNYSAFGFIFKINALVFPNCFPTYNQIPQECDVMIVPVAVTITGQATITTGELSILSHTLTGGCGDHTLQWQKYVGGEWVNITGATGSTLFVVGSSYGVGAHPFRLHVVHDTDPCDGVSNTFTVTVTAL
jgi:hypothetical protein